MGVSLPDEFVNVQYQNYRGEVGWRKVLPTRIWFGTTEWHLEPQWFVDVIDATHGRDRSLAMKDILQWGNE